MNGKLPTRKFRPLLIVATVLMLAPAGYFVAYYANLKGGSIVYILQSQPSTSALTGLLTTREVPAYRFAQNASEVIFWPAYKIDGWLRPHRSKGPNSPGTMVPEYRDEWWP